MQCPGVTAAVTGAHPPIWVRGGGGAVGGGPAGVGDAAPGALPAGPDHAFASHYAFGGGRRVAVTVSEPVLPPLAGIGAV